METLLVRASEEHGQTITIILMSDGEIVKAEKLVHGCDDARAGLNFLTSDALQHSAIHQSEQPNRRPLQCFAAELESAVKVDFIAPRMAQG